MRSACGGDSDNSAPESQDPPQDQPTDEDDNTDDDAGDDDNTDAAALDVTSEWLTASDQIEVSTTIDPAIADLTGSYAHLNVYVPQAYTAAGNMIVQVFFQDASDRKAYIGYRTAAAGWNSDNSAGSTVSHDAEASALVITPDWENADEGANRPKAMGVTTNVISTATVRMIVTLTEAQVDGGIGIQPYIQQNSGSYSQAFGPIITENLVAGDNLVTYEAGELADAMRIGVQLVGPITEGEGDVALIKQVEIDLPEGSVEEPSNEISVDMTSGWRVNPDTITWEYTAEGVSYQPTAANDQLVFDPAGPLDMRGGSIDFVYEVDQAFIESGANLQPFFQLKDYASYDYVFCWIGNGSLATGEQTFTCDVPATLENGSDAQIPDGQTAQAGVQTNGGGAGTVTIKSVTINPAPTE